MNAWLGSRLFSFGLILIAAVNGGCSRAPSGKGEGTAKSEQAVLSATTLRTYGFESLSDWSAI